MAKTTNGKAAAAVGKVKTAISLSPRAFKKLGAACVFLDQNQSELLESLISTHLAGYRVVNDQAKSIVQAAPIDRQSEAIHAMENAPSMA